MLWMVLSLTFLSAVIQPDNRGKHPDIQLFLMASSQDALLAEDALRQISSQWHNAYAGIILDVARLMRRATSQSFRFSKLIEFLEQETGQQFGSDFSQWQEWIWDQPYDPHPDYELFKGLWYRQIDPRFAEFFPDDVVSLIRLDEIEWGGVVVNGIPPLSYPVPLEAVSADYLADDHIVFGLAINGQFRAYPKRILAWHELVLDRLGDVELTIVYCTLCGTVIPFESVVNGRHLKFGTSGLLYRSNKLMFDIETRSLWNTFTGMPVVGLLAEKGLKLTPHAVVTTTWGEWRRQHPSTSVLSLDTGYQRDYSEGSAYQDYFSTDDLMFQVSMTDDRLAKKEEVLVLQLADVMRIGRDKGLAITARFLKENRVFHYTFFDRNMVIVTSEHGANRVYDAQDIRFVKHIDSERVVDDFGREWRITEAWLVLDGDSSMRRIRLPAQRAFWFGWYAQFPDTELIY